MGHNRFIAECTSYNLKQMLERKKVKSWLKSVSAFANTEGGSLFFGITDEHFVVGLPNPQADADFISETINNLTKAGIIEREGGKRYGKWRVK